MQRDLDRMHEAARLPRYALFVHTLLFERSGKRGHLRPPEAVGFLTMKALEGFCTSFDFGCAPMDGELYNRHAFFVL
ncbi:hypothetical protein GGD50_004303 [Rhizobium paranaense]|uniref:Uncharacterized protein n=1 Tax=Rhizobium paranaense TaxID=1650438 RepID=A0A7W8XU69_9HYPH|nr:hypothetical protein [Rhizobium paranaense]